MLGLPIAAVVLLALAVAACAGAAPTSVPPTSAPAPTTAAQPTSAPAAGGMDALIAAAKAEGTLNVVALPDTWLNYGQIKKNFTAKYGIKLNDNIPDAGSKQEVQSIIDNKSSKGPQAPDVIDVGFSFGPDAKSQGLLEPYKVATWDEIPSDVKDPDGSWYGDYYGCFSFAVNTNVIKNVPQDWADLLKPEYKGEVAPAGDPRLSNQAIQAVEAAALANGGSLDNAQPGLDYFSKMNKAGNLLPLIGDEGQLAKGETPILITWDYLALGYKQDLKGNPDIQVVVPASGVFCGVYVQAISKYAPHPNAAKLWMEYLYSDEGQLIWLSGFGHPIRYNAMAKAGKIPANLAAQLPPADVYAKGVFATPAQLAAAQALVTKNWDSVVGTSAGAFPTATPAPK
jgi:putative spermidine/putrescine transport system substrate-binding protein